MQAAIRSAFLFVICMVVVSLLGCASARMYSGAPLPSDQVAFLERGDLSQVLRSFDDRRYNYNLFIMNEAVELLPGEHTVVVAYNTGSKYSEEVTLTFTAKPGTRYVLKSNADGMRWSPSIVEKK